MIQIILELLENPNVLLIPPMVGIGIAIIILIAIDKTGDNTTTANILSYVFLILTLCVFFIIIDWESLCTPLKATFE